MPATFYVPGCQQKGGNSSAGEKVWFYLDFLVAHGGENSGSMQFVDTKERSLPSIVRGK